MKNRTTSILISLFLSPILLAQDVPAVDSCEDIDLTCRNGKTYPIHMTFDDGPARQTPQVLDTLDSEGVKATFFFMGSKLVNRDGTKFKKSSTKNLLDDIKRRGHHVASHTFFHIRHRNEAWIEQGLTDNSRDKVDADSLNRNHMTWRENINVPKNSPILQKYMNENGKMYFRLPYGEGWYRSKRGNDADNIVLSELLSTTDTGIHPRHVGWDIDTEDWRNPPRDKFFASLRQQICSRKGGVLLMHDHTKSTKNYLKCILVGAKKAGHHFVDSPEDFINRKGRNKVVMKYEEIPGITLPPEQQCSNNTETNEPVDELGKLITEIENKVTDDHNATQPNPTDPNTQDDLDSSEQDLIDELF